MNRVVTHVLVGAIGVAGGFGIGYLVAKKRTEAYIDSEIESVKEAYSQAPWRNKPDLAELTSQYSALTPQVMAADRTIVENLLTQSGYSYHEVEDGDRVSISGVDEMPDEDMIAHVDDEGHITLNAIDPVTGLEVIPEEPDPELLREMGEPTPEEMDQIRDAAAEAAVRNVDAPMAVNVTPTPQPEDTALPITQNLWDDNSIAGQPAGNRVLEAQRAIEEGEAEPDLTEREDGLDDPESVPLSGAASRPGTTPDLEATTNPDAEEMPAPDPDRPYVITVDQFMTDSVHEDDQVSLVYFDEDDILIDDRNVQEREVERTVGTANLTKFGLGSRDPNIVYIRNDKLGTDYEIVREERSFAEVVLGQKPDRQKSGPLRMREHDE